MPTNTSTSPVDTAGADAPATRATADALCMVHYYVRADAAGHGEARLEPDVVRHYTRSAELPTSVSFLGSVFESPLFSRFRRPSKGDVAKPLAEHRARGTTEAEPEVDVAQAKDPEPLSMVTYYVQRDGVAGPEGASSQVAGLGWGEGAKGHGGRQRRAAKGRRPHP